MEVSACENSASKIVGNVVKTAKDRNFFNAGEIDASATLKIVVIGSGISREFAIENKG